MQILQSFVLSTLLLGCNAEAKPQLIEQKKTITLSGNIKGLFTPCSLATNNYYSIQFELHDLEKNKDYLIGTKEFIITPHFQGPLETRGLIARLKAIENNYRANVTITAKEEQGFYDPVQFTFEDGTVYIHE